MGWCGELNLEYTLEKLFDGEFGIGYPKEDAARKRQETALLISFNQLTKKTLLEIIDEMDEGLLRKIANRKTLYQYINENAKNRALVDKLQRFLG